MPDGPARLQTTLPRSVTACRTGFVEGRNVAIEYRWAEGRYDRLPALAADLVRRQVSMIAVGSIPAVQAAKATTTAIPIVFVTGGDPVQLGLVAALNRPGGNLSGVTYLGMEVEPKRLELLHELVPAAATIAVLLNPTNPNVESQTKGAREAARAFGARIHFLHASTEQEVYAAFASLPRLRAAALLVGADRSSLAGASRSSRSRPTTPSPRSTRCAATLKSAA